MINLHIINSPLYHTRTSHFHLVFQIWLCLCVQDIWLTGHLEVIRRLLVADNILDQIGISSASCLDLQLDCTSTIEETKEEPCFINSAPSGEEAVIKEDSDLENTLSAQIRNSMVRGSKRTSTLFFSPSAFAIFRPSSSANTIPPYEAYTAMESCRVQIS